MTFGDLPLKEVAQKLSDNCKFVEDFCIIHGIDPADCGLLAKEKRALKALGVTPEGMKGEYRYG